MVTESYRLETLSARVIERLEGTRRSYADRPDEFRAVVSRTTREVLASTEAEYRELFQDAGPFEHLRRELTDTFEPRYLRLAQDQTAFEQRGYDAWRAGDPLSRVVGFVVAILIATVLSRLVRSPVMMLGYLAAFVVPFLPELRARLHHRRYAAELQSLVHDMSRVQAQLEAFPTPALDAPAQTPEPTKAPPPLTDPSIH